MRPALPGHSLQEFLRSKPGGSHRGPVRSQPGSPSRAWYILLLVPFIGLLWPPFYAKQDPELAGFPFFVKDLPLIIAFVILALYTYQSGLRAPAMIAFVKDTLISITVLVAVYIPTRLGGWSHIFRAAAQALPGKKPTPGALILPRSSTRPTRRSRSARRSRCSCTRTRSRRC
ncbi:MAG TPA: hypothetical protein VKG45_00335 [Actinomycetes bacterium]|nr:hypothetical protein [Actinomycetes bacterium]